MRSGVNFKQLQDEFWINFQKYLEERRFPLKQKAMSYAHARTFSSDISGTFYSSIVQEKPTHRQPGDLFSNELRVELVVEGSSKINIENINNQMDTLQKYFDFPVICKIQEGKRSKLVVRKSFDASDQNFWLNQFLWLEDNLRRMHRALYSEILKK